MNVISNIADFLLFNTKKKFIVDKKENKIFESNIRINSFDYQNNFREAKKRYGEEFDGFVLEYNGENYIIKANFIICKFKKNPKLKNGEYLMKNVKDTDKIDGYYCLDLKDNYRFINYEEKQNKNDWKNLLIIKEC